MTMLYPSMHFHWFLFESKSFGRILKQKEVKNCWILDGIFKEFLCVVKSKSWRLNKLSIDLLKIYPCTESTSLKPFFTLRGLFALLLLLNPWSKPSADFDNVAMRLLMVEGLGVGVGWIYVAVLSCSFGHFEFIITMI